MFDDEGLDQRFMLEALREARQATLADEVPVGAVVVYQGQVVARAHNQVETLKDATAHAEMIALTQAMGFLKSKWLQGCTLYVTLEPCRMCAGALVLSRLDRVVFGTTDPKTGACGSVVEWLACPGLNHQPTVTGGVMADQCGELLSTFFSSRRVNERNKRFD